MCTLLSCKKKKYFLMHSQVVKHMPKQQVALKPIGPIQPIRRLKKIITGIRTKKFLCELTPFYFVMWLHKIKSFRSRYIFFFGTRVAQPVGLGSVWITVRVPLSRQPGKVCGTSIELHCGGKGIVWGADPDRAHRAADRGGQSTRRKRSGLGQEGQSSFLKRADSGSIIFHASQRMKQHGGTFPLGL